MSRKRAAGSGPRVLPSAALPPLEAPQVAPRPTPLPPVAAAPAFAVAPPPSPASASHEALAADVPRSSSTRGATPDADAEPPRAGRGRDRWVAAGVLASVVASLAALAIVVVRGSGDVTRTTSTTRERTATETSAEAPAAAEVRPKEVVAAPLPEARDDDGTDREARGDRGERAPSGPSVVQRPVPGHVAGGRRVTPAMAELGRALALPPELLAGLAGEGGEVPHETSRLLQRWFGAGERLGVRLGLGDDDRSFLGGRFAHHLARTLREHERVGADPVRRELVDQAVTVDTLEDVRRNLGDEPAAAARLELARMQREGRE